ncbi:hypothetical protein PENSPDRAFT_683153 [Peniophora sp. CONT]|nr:hypothetical protein PENSPDRAFT_683153 [Peniophora sp. CONT]
MEDLLTASENHAIKSFLSNINYDGTLVDSLVASNEWANLGEDGIPVPHAQGREALAKATKDLMSLSSLQHNISPELDLDHPRPPQHLFQPPPQSAPQHALVSSFHTWEQALRGSYPRAQSTSSQSLLGDVSPTSSASPLTMPAASSSTSTLKRAAESAAPNSPATAKRPRTSSTRSSNNNGAGSSRNDGAGSGGSGGGPKPALLTPSQKKANHIQSEQKRRANIRRGYEALCGTIPALVEAIAVEDAATAAAKEAGTVQTGKKSRRRKGKDREEEDKADGRAGPRSENVVLGKTVEYIENLLARRAVLIDRLYHARAMFPPGHPAHMPACAPEQPLWERQWTGGQGLDDDDDGGDDE